MLKVDIIRIDHYSRREVLWQMLDEAFGDTPRFTKKEYMQSLQNPAHIYFIYTNTCCRKRLIGTFEIKQGIELASFCIRPKFRRKGYGRQVISCLKHRYPGLVVLAPAPGLKNTLYRGMECIDLE